MPSACSSLAIASLGGSLSDICRQRHVAADKVGCDRLDRCQREVHDRQEVQEHLPLRPRCRCSRSPRAGSPAPACERIGSPRPRTSRRRRSPPPSRPVPARTRARALVSGPASRVARSPSAARVSEIVPWTSRAAKTWSVSFVAIDCLDRGVVRERRDRRHVPIGVQDGPSTPCRRHGDGEDDDRRARPGWGSGPAAPPPLLGLASRVSTRASSSSRSAFSRSTSASSSSGDCSCGPLPSSFTTPPFPRPVQASRRANGNAPSDAP